MGKFPIKTEDDVKKMEIAKTLANELINNIKKVAIEHNLDEKKDYRKIIKIIKKEEKNGIE